MYLFSCFEIKIQNDAHLIEKGLFLTYVSHFLVTRENTQKFLQHISISHLHTYTYFSPPMDFFAFPILQNSEFIMHGFSFICGALQQKVLTALATSYSFGMNREAYYSVISAQQSFQLVSSQEIQYDRMKAITKY